MFTTLATGVGTFAHAIAARRQRQALTASERTAFDEDLSVRLRQAAALVP